MPLITTHNYFAKDIFDSIPNNIKDTFKEKQNLYELFAQGFDPFIFYDFFKIKKGNLQNYCHTHNTDTFFLNFIKEIKTKNEKNNPNILASLYGHMAHYILDSTCHPFIIYKTGEYDKKNPETIKYKGQHNIMEMQIDAYFYNIRTKNEFKNSKIHKHLITKEKFNKDLLDILNIIYKKTFDIDKGGNKYQKGSKNMYYSYKILIEDKTGIKKQIYKFIDKLTPKKQDYYQNFSSNINKIDLNIFNLEHKLWLNPYDKNITSKESFFDLYNKALKEAKELFIATHKYINDEINEQEFKIILKDKSYTSGLSWHIKSKIKYLEF